jgi:hypothetical protein
MNETARAWWAAAQRRLWVREAYRRLFGLGQDGQLSRDGQTVLADLARFCRVHEPATRRDLTGRVDPLATAHQEGRREVGQRIIAMLHVSDRDLWRVIESESEG